MRGSTMALSFVMFTLIAVATAALFFGYINRLKSDVTAAGEAQMIELDVPPKLMSLICYDGYGYMFLSLSQGQDAISGQALFSVEKDTGQLVAEEFLNISLSDASKVFIPYAFNTSERYLVSLGGRKWEISEYCNPINDPHSVLHLKFDEGTGSTAADSTEFGNDGTVTGPSWTTGVSGSALTFDGTDYVQVPGSDSLNITSEVTIMAWVNELSPAADVKLVSRRNVNYSYFLGSYNGEISAGVCNGTWTTHNSQVGIDSGWHHTAVTFRDSDSTLRFYLDGVSVHNESASGELVAFNADLGVGAETASPPAWTNFFTGDIDDVRVYDRALGPREIGALYRAYS